MKRYKQLLCLILSASLAAPAAWATAPNSPRGPQSTNTAENPPEIGMNFHIATNHEELELIIDQLKEDSEEAPTDILLEHPEPLPINYDEIEPVHMPTNAWQRVKEGAKSLKEKVQRRIEIMDSKPKLSVKERLENFLIKIKKEEWKYNLFFGSVRFAVVGTVVYQGFVISGIPEEAARNTALTLGGISGGIQFIANKVYSPFLTSPDKNPFAAALAGITAPLSKKSLRGEYEIIKNKAPFKVLNGFLRFFVTEYMILGIGAAVIALSGAPQYAGIIDSLWPLAVASFFASIGQFPGDYAFSTELKDGLHKTLASDADTTTKEHQKAHYELKNAAQILSLALFANFFVGMGAFEGSTKELGRGLLTGLMGFGALYLAHVMMVRNSKPYLNFKTKMKEKVSKLKIGVSGACSTLLEKGSTSIPGQVTN